MVYYSMSPVSVSVSWVDICWCGKVFVEHLIVHKLYPHNLGESCGIAAGDSLMPPKLLLLYRKSLLDSFISLKIAFKNDIWYSASGALHIACLSDFKLYLEIQLRTVTLNICCVRETE